MNVLKRLRDLLSPPQPSVTATKFEIPCGLTPPEWEDLKALPGARGWDAYLKALDEGAKLYVEALIGASKDENLHFFRGAVAGLRKAGTLIAELKASEDAYLDAERKRAPRDSTDARRHATFGSAAWRSRAS